MGMRMLATLVLLPVSVVLSQVGAGSETVEGQDPVLPNDTLPEGGASGQQQGPNCSRCASMLDEARSLRLQTIKLQILSRLGMTQAPNFTGTDLPAVPPLNELLDSYGMQADGGPSFIPGPEYDEHQGGQDPDRLTAERVITFAQEPPDGLEGRLRDERSLFFAFSPSLYSSHVSRAHLWIYVKPNNHVSRSSTVWIVVYQLSGRNGTGELDLFTVRHKKVETRPDKGFWVEINLRNVVAQWFHRPESNLGLVAHSYDQQGQIQLLVLDPRDEPGLVPFLDVRVEAAERRRSRRMVGLNCDDNANEVRCCRYPLTVDFEEFGWDWIIAPKRYEANYCSGECSYAFLPQYVHTHVVQQAGGLVGSVGACCAPKKVANMSMLYLNEHKNIVYGSLPGMVVEQCGCA